MAENLNDTNEGVTGAICSNCEAGAPHELSSFIRCTECRLRNVDIILCVKCFSSGAECGPHKRGHNYQVEGPFGSSFFKVRDPEERSWGFREDEGLILAAVKSKLGNWDDIASSMKSGKTGEEAKIHFDRHFVRGPIGRHAFSNIYWPFIDDMTANATIPEREPLYEGPELRFTGPSEYQEVVDAVGRLGPEVTLQDSNWLEAVEAEMANDGLREPKRANSTPASDAPIDGDCSTDALISFQPSNVPAVTPSSSATAERLATSFLTGSDTEDVAPLKFQKNSKLPLKTGEKADGGCESSGSSEIGVAATSAKMTGCRRKDENSRRSTARSGFSSLTPSRAQSSDEEHFEELGDSSKGRSGRIAEIGGSSSWRTFRNSESFETYKARSGRVLDEIADSSKGGSGRISEETGDSSKVRIRRGGTRKPAGKSAKISSRKRTAGVDKLQELLEDGSDEACYRSPLALMSEQAKGVLRETCPDTFFARCLPPPLINTDVARLKRDDLQMLGYIPERDDFDTEYNNGIERLVSRLNVTSLEDPFENDLNIAKIQRYNRVLKHRMVRKAIAREHNLVKVFIDKAKNIKPDRKKGFVFNQQYYAVLRQQKQAAQSLTIAHQVLKKDEMLELLESITGFSMLSKRITELQTLQKSGVKVLPEKLKKSDDFKRKRKKRTFQGSSSQKRANLQWNRLKRWNIRQQRNEEMEEAEESDE